MAAISTGLVAAGTRAALGLHRLAGGARLPILIFHRVLPKPDPLFPEEMHAARFDALLAMLARSYEVISVGAAAERLADGRPGRALAISFDDGYADNAEVALPLLQKHGLPASFFIASGFLNGGCMWNDAVIAAVRHSPLEQADLRDIEGLADIRTGPADLRTTAARRALIDQLLPKVKYAALERRQVLISALRRRLQAPDAPHDLMMSTAQLRALRAAGMEIGGHTIHHPILQVLPEAEARQEIIGGKQALEALLNEPVEVFAYPNGKPGQDYDAVHAAMAAEAGFKSAVSTSVGIASPGDDRYQLPRFTPWREGGAPWMLQLLAQYRQPYRFA
ncbi:MAG TPA: polysaccharide deacetylase family protein [Burkholderiaceae bacterium]